ncbi:MAG: iron ABC transporter permease [Cyanobacteria bacterium P01_D01_bin.73]
MKSPVSSSNLSPPNPWQRLQAHFASAGQSQWLSGWTLAVLVIAGLIMLPILTVLQTSITTRWGLWHHLATTVLPNYIFNSIALGIGVGTITVILGTGMAWLVSLCQFPGRRILEWALLLPMAIPAYLLAYTYTNFLDFYGPVQTTLQNITGWDYGDYWYPNVRSLEGAIIMLSLVLYPYIYLLVRVAFLEQSTATIEASRILGRSPWKSFFSVALPLARPAIMAGLALVMMETLSDFGTVEYFGVNTFTTGIYSTWFGLGDRPAASQLASVLLIVVIGLITLERYSRGQARHYGSESFKPVSPYLLRGWHKWGAMFFCGFPLILAFFIPAGRLAWMAAERLQKNPALITEERFISLVSNTLVVGSITAILGMILALILGYGQRLNSHWIVRTGTRFASMGYAIPGSVVAVGLLIPLGWIDQTVDRFMENTFDISTGLILSGSIVALVFAYLVRFLSVAFNTVESSLVKIKPNLDDASRSLGHSPTQTLWRVHLPILRGGLLTTVLLVFVDSAKELPATLIVRPFNFDTLSYQVFALASDERLGEAALPAIAILLVGLVPTLILSWQITQARQLKSQ